MPESHWSLIMEAGIFGMKSKLHPWSQIARLEVKRAHSNPYPVHILTVVHFVLIAPLCAVACCSRPPSSLLAVTCPRRTSVRSALGRSPITASCATSCSASIAEVCGSYVHRSGLHWPPHGRLVLDYQRVVRLSSGKAVSQLCHGWFKCSPWCAA